MTDTSYQYDNDFARTIREARSRTKYSQTDVAAHLGISRSHYVGLETGSQTTRNRSMIYKIADFFALNRETLFALAPEVNIKTIQRRAKRAKDGPPPVRKARRMLTGAILPENAAIYIQAAERLSVDPDELFVSFDTIPPDMLQWLKGNLDHIKQVRRLMEAEGNET